MNEKHEPIHEKQSLNELTNETPDCQELDDDALEGTSGGADFLFFLFLTLINNIHPHRV